MIVFMVRFPYVASHRDRDAVLLEHVQQPWNIGSRGRELLAHVPEHLGGAPALAADLEHPAAAGAEAKAVHCACRNVHQRAWLAQSRFAFATDLDFAVENEKRFVPTVTVRRWPDCLPALQIGRAHV